MKYGIFTTTRGKFYNARSGKKRLKYVLRDQYYGNNTTEPSIRIWKYDRTLSKDELYNLYDFNSKYSNLHHNKQNV